MEILLPSAAHVQVLKEAVNPRPGAEQPALMEAYNQTPSVILEHVGETLELLKVWSAHYCMPRFFPV